MAREEVDDDDVSLSSKGGDDIEMEPADEGGKAKTVEETYQKKTPLEHILLRPDTYSKSNSSLCRQERETEICNGYPVGSTEHVTQPMYVLDKENGKIVEKEITFTPGLYKIFDEYVDTVYLHLALLSRCSRCVSSPGLSRSSLI